MPSSRLPKAAQAQAADISFPKLCRRIIELFLASRFLTQAALGFPFH